MVSSGRGIARNRAATPRLEVGIVARCRLPSVHVGLVLGDVQDRGDRFLLAVTGIGRFREQLRDIDIHMFFEFKASVRLSASLRASFIATLLLESNARGFRGFRTINPPGRQRCSYLAGVDHADDDVLLLEHLLQLLPATTIMWYRIRRP